MDQFHEFHLKIDRIQALYTVDSISARETFESYSGDVIRVVAKEVRVLIPDTAAR